MSDPSGVRTSLPVSEWTKDRPYLRGTWYAHRLRRGVHTRRPHYYVWSERDGHYDWKSLCGFSTRHDQDLVIDPDTGISMEIDPLIGDYQMRRLCGHCLNILEPGPTTNEIVQEIAASWQMVRRDSPRESEVVVTGGVVEAAPALGLTVRKLEPYEGAGGSIEAAVSARLAYDANHTGADLARTWIEAESKLTTEQYLAYQRLYKERRRG